MKNTDDEPRRLSFKDFTVVDYVPGEGQYINYQAQKRHRGTVGEEVEQIDEAMQYLSKDELPAKVQRVVTNLFKIAKKEKKSIQRLSVYLVNKKYAIDVELGNKLNDDEDFVGKLMSVASFRDKFVSVDVSSSVSPAPNVSIKESVEHLDEKVRPLEMTQAKYDSYPKNKKGKSGGKLYIIQNQKSGVTKGGVKFTSLGGGAGTTKVPVKIVKELPYKYEESVEQTDEAYTVAQRIKAKQRMKKMSKRIQMAKKRAMKRAPSTEKLKLRARKQAKGALVSKWMRGKQKGELSFAQRQNIEKRLKSASGRIDTMSKKLLPDVRKQDRERRSNAKNKSEEK